jgi:hypothetical protein
LNNSANQKISIPITQPAPSNLHSLTNHSPQTHDLMPSLDFPFSIRKDLYRHATPLKYPFTPPLTHFRIRLLLFLLLSLALSFGLSLGLAPAQHSYLFFLLLVLPLVSL